MKMWTDLKYRIEKMKLDFSIGKRAILAGDKIRQKRDFLYQEYLVLNRQKKNTGEITIKLEMLDWVINDIEGKIY